jgi:hypothetical protein
MRRTDLKKSKKKIARRSAKGVVIREGSLKI